MFWCLAPVSWTLGLGPESLFDQPVQSHQHGATGIFHEVVGVEAVGYGPPQLDLPVVVSRPAVTHGPEDRETRAVREVCHHQLAIVAVDETNAPGLRLIGQADQTELGGPGHAVQESGLPAVLLDRLHHHPSALVADAGREGHPVRRVAAVDEKHEIAAGVHDRPTLEGAVVVAGQQRGDGGRGQTLKVGPRSGRVHDSNSEVEHTQRTSLSRSFLT